MICPNQPLHCDAYSRFGSAGDPLRWYISQPAKCGPLTSHRWRLPSDVRMNAPLRVPTNTRIPLIRHSSSSVVKLCRSVASPRLCTTRRSVVTRGGTSLLAINHPRDAESIDHHAESRGPEGLLHWHLHFTALLQFLKDPFSFRNFFHAGRQRETLRRLIVLGRSIRAHQHRTADGHAGMHDLITPFWRHLFRHGRFAMGHHGLDFPAKAFLIELKCSLALPVEGEISIQLHRLLLSRISCQKSCSRKNHAHLTCEMQVTNATVEMCQLASQLPSAAPGVP